MGLTGRLARFAFACPRPLLAVAPAGTACRLAVERELRARGGRLARSAAEADTLVVCGTPSAPLAEAIERIWAQIPAPRARVTVTRPVGASMALDEAAELLVDIPQQRRDAARRQAMSGDKHGQHSSGEPGGGPDGAGPHEDHDGGREMSGEMPMAGDGHGGEHGGRGGGMPMPGGQMMAGRGPDRDGLMLDRWHVQLGPVLPEWPAGLLVRVTLQGDVIQEAEPGTVPPGPGVAGPGFWDELAVRAARGEPVDEGAAARRLAAAHADSAARLLALAGWEQAAGAARRLRDDLLDGFTPAGGMARLARRVRRSATLRWLLSGLAPLSAQPALLGPPAGAGGDAWARLTRWLDGAAAALAGQVPAGTGPRGPADGRAPSADMLDVLSPLVTGLDLATARLAIASLDPDLDQLLPVPAEAARG